MDKSTRLPDDHNLASRDLASHVLAGERVEAVNWSQNRSLFAERVKIFPKRVKGTYRTIKWWFMAVLLGIYYFAPWIRWDRGPNAPDQAILIDLPARRFYFFNIEIWPQEVYYLTGLLILAAVGLFAATSLFGRVWCAWGCPQTVWTDLYMLVERWIEGDRNARIRLDKGPWTLGKIFKRVAKHAIWIVIAMLTGGAWIFYFADAPTLGHQLLALNAPPAAWITIAFLTGTTYLMAGFAREQVCTYMCPYARFQSVMLDEESYIVTYRGDRGEPRGPHKRGTSWEGRGHCVDCNACVAVCPTGIDIRNGQQIECINCGLCIDACNIIMDRLDLPRGLIAHDTLANISRRAKRRPMALHLVRPRTFVYIGILALVAGIMAYALATRSVLDINVLSDRNPLYVVLSNGDIRNGYTFKIINKLHEQREFKLSVNGIKGAKLSVVGLDLAPGDTPRFRVGPDKLASFRVFVEAPRASLTGVSTAFTFVLTDTASGAQARYSAIYRGPGLNR